MGKDWILLFDVFFKPNIYSVYQGSLSRKPSPRSFASTEKLLFNSSPTEK